jgi:molecular chaperone GrpE
MNKPNHSDPDDRIEIEVNDPAPIAPGSIEDAVEKGEDFSSEAESIEEEGQLAEEPTPQSRIAELEERLLRVAAEFENYKKRTNRQFEEMTRAANDRLVLEILEVVDSFDRARQHAGDEVDASALKKGMDLIYNQLQALLEKNDVTPIEALGKPFDPQVHDAQMQLASAKFPEGTVAMELTRGFRQGNRVIRHSKVGVSTGKPA